MLRKQRFFYLICFICVCFCTARCYSNDRIDLPREQGRVEEVKGVFWDVNGVLVDIKKNKFYLKKILPRHGMREVFSHFASLGVPQCAVSNGRRREVDASLLIAGVKEDMVFSISADDVKKTKPNPEPYLTAVSKLREKFGWTESKTDNARFIAVEDTITGATAAVRAGLTTILWSKDPNATYPGAITVHTAADFLKVCQELTAGQE